MKVVFETNEVFSKLFSVTSVINPKSTIPILSDVCISVNDKSIIFTASDGENWATKRADVLTSDMDAVFCTPAKDIINCLGALFDENVTMSLDEEGKTMTLEYTNGKINLPYESADEFPTPNINIDGASDFIVNSSLLKSHIKLAKSSTENSTIRPIMGGVHFRFDGEKMIINGASHKRIVKLVENIKLDNSANYHEFTLPPAASSVITKVLDGVDQDVKVRFTDKVVSISNKDFKITARLLEGRFPDCDMVIPKVSPVKIEVDNDMVIQALKRVLSIDNMNRLVVFSICGDNINISAEDVNFFRKSEESVKCDCNIQNELVICFNGDVMLETLRSIESDTVVFEMSEPRRPALIGSKYEKDREKYVCVIMPMAVQPQVVQQ